jgi:hypothetical protein
VKITCTRTGKQTFGTYGRALKYALIIARRTGQTVRVYRCEFCGFHHLTTHAYDAQRRRAS